MRAMTTSIDLAKLPVSFLGRELTVDLVGEMVALGCDPCGENGEYHSFVFDGPLFHRPVDFEKRDAIVGNDFAHLPLVPAK
jgi:diphthamide synthase (EF-2-diphthine--ammonia ligase)